MKQFMIFLSLCLRCLTVFITAQTLEDIIRSNDDLTILASAIDIVGWIPYDGDMTMFFPNNDALSPLDPKYLTPSYMPHLKTIISYHVAPEGVISSEYITDGTVLGMFAGTGSISATVNETGLFWSGESFSESQVVMKDLYSSDGTGVGHIVDQFFFPSQLDMTLFELAGSVEGFDQVFNLVIEAGLEGELMQDNRTILAPSDAAFSSFSSDLMAQIVSDPDFRDDMLRYHILIGCIPLELFVDRMQIMTALGAPIVVSVQGGGRFQQISVSNPSLGDSIAVETGNLVAGTGIAHAVSGVLETGPRPPLATPVDAPSGGDPGTSPGNAPTGSSSGSFIAARNMARFAGASAFSALFLF